MSAVSFSTIAQPNPGALVLIEVPEKVVKKLGAGKRVPVRVTLNGVDYRSTIAVYGDRYYLPARKEGAIEVQRADEGAGARRGTRGPTAKRPAKAKAEAGQWPREGPPSTTDPSDGEHEPYDAFSFSHRKEFVDWVSSAKRRETRAARIPKVVAHARAKARAASPR